MTHDKAGLCPECVHVRITRNKRGSEFLQCLYSKIDDSYPKYPRLPVYSCAAYKKR